MSREKAKGTSITLRVTDEWLARVDDGVENRKLAKNRTDLLEQGAEEILKKGTDEDVDLDREALDLVDKIRNRNMPPSPRSLIVNWAIKEFLSKL